MLVHIEQRHENVRRPHAAVRSHSQGRFGETIEHAHQVARQHAHHRATGRVERNRGGVWHASVDRRLSRRPYFFHGRHCFDPNDIGATIAQTLDLRLKRRRGDLRGERTEGSEQLTGRADRTGDDHRSISAVGNLACELGGDQRQFANSPLGLMQLETLRRSTKTVGENNVGTGVDEALKQTLHTVRMIEVPEFRRLARGEPHLEVVRSRGPVGEKSSAGSEKVSESRTHAPHSRRSGSPTRTLQPDALPLPPRDRVRNKIAAVTRVRKGPSFCAFRAKSTKEACLAGRFLEVPDLFSADERTFAIVKVWFTWKYSKRRLRRWCCVPSHSSMPAAPPTLIEVWRR